MRKVGILYPPAGEICLEERVQRGREDYVGLIAKLSTEFLESYPQDAAAVLEDLPTDSVNSLLTQAGAATASKVLERSAPHYGAAVLEKMEPEYAGEVVAEMAPALAANVLRRVKRDRRERVLETVLAERIQPIRALLRFPEGTAGALMDTQVLAIPEDTTVNEAVKQYRSHPERTLNYLYVVDRQHRLVGVLNLRELLQAPPNDTLGAIMRPASHRLGAKTGRQAIVDHPGWQVVHSLPVVDEKGVFLGVLRYGAFRKLEAELRSAEAASGPNATTRALADLFLTGLVGVVQVGATIAEQGAGPQRPSRR